MAKIEGLDISHWQGSLTIAKINKMLAKGIKFVGVKFSQGTYYKDSVAEHNTALLQSKGILVFPYHFVTVESGQDQYDWFAQCTRNIQFDLPPAMDCEHYSEPSKCSANKLGCEEGEVLPVLAFRRNKIPLKNRLGDIVGAYLIPSEATVDVIGTRMRQWMKLQPRLGIFSQPSIYTNVYSGNAIFKSPSMSKYGLWVANWGVSTPYLPNIWVGKKYIIWQDDVIDGQPYGIDGDVDHNVWGKLYDFPGGTTPPQPSSSPSPSPSPSQPPPSNDYFDVVATHSSGKIYRGRVE